MIPPTTIVAFSDELQKIAGKRWSALYDALFRRHLKTRTIPAAAALAGVGVSSKLSAPPAPGSHSRAAVVLPEVLPSYEAM